MMLRIQRLAAWITMLLVCTASANAATRYVSGNGSDANSGASWFFAKRTISNALAGAAPGDEVWVSAATYHEHISIPNGVKLYGGFFGQETSVGARTFPLPDTILDGDGSGLGVFFATYGGQMGVDGFIIRNYNLGVNGGGSGAYLTVANCKITGNHAAAEGWPAAAIYFQDSSGITLVNNIISDNSNTNGGNSALFLPNWNPIPCTLTMTNNVIQNNLSTQGRTTLLFGMAVVTITGDTISSNTAYGDAGLHIEQCSAVTISGANVENNNNNAAPYQDNQGQTVYPYTFGGIAIFGASTLGIDHSHIHGNTGNITGGLRIQGGAVTLDSCEVSGNRAVGVPFTDGGMYANQTQYHL